MWKTIVRRLLILIPQLFVLSLVIFILAQIMPGDALTGFVDPNVSGEDLERLREQLGLNRPMHEQYISWISGVLVGDFGRSWHHARPVIDVIGERAANTFRLALVTTFFAYLLAVPLGLIAGRFKETVIDKAIILYTYFAMSIPTIILALIFMFIFGFNLRWFPIAGSVDVTAVPGSFSYFISRVYHLILPGFTGALLSTTFLINQLRSEIIDNENSDYVTTARSKGVPKRKIYTRHIFKNSSLPVISSLGMAVAFFLTGSIFIELLFSYPGMGNLFFTAINQRDFPVTNALIILYATLLVSGTLISDILMSVIDPRVRIK